MQRFALAAAQKAARRLRFLCRAPKKESCSMELRLHERRGLYSTGPTYPKCGAVLVGNALEKVQGRTVPPTREIVRARNGLELWGCPSLA